MISLAHAIGACIMLDGVGTLRTHMQQDPLDDPVTPDAPKRRGCPGCAERYPLNGPYHVLPNGGMFKCSYADDDHE